jgi:hypothetical protein
MYPDKSVDQAPACFPKIDPRLRKVGAGSNLGYIYRPRLATDVDGNFH